MTFRSIKARLSIEEMNFVGKSILITGGSSGIGADAAIHLAKCGASIAIIGRDATKLNTVANTIRQAGSGDPLEIVADVTRDAERIVNETIQKFGKLDVLVNNAGIGFINAEPLGTLDEFDRVMNTNVRSIIQLTKLAVPHLEVTKGNVVNVSSISGSSAAAGCMAYSLSKAALNHFTRCAAVELAPKGIRVNAVLPGLVVTPIHATAGLSTERIEQLYEKSRREYPVGRIGVVEDTSSAIAFLASDAAASFLTGHLLYVDGGKSLV